MGLGLDEKAIEAVEQWKFRPGCRDGKPVAAQVIVEMNFSFGKKPVSSDASVTQRVPFRATDRP
ncbi:MAG: hypothetical protein DMG57_23670 [Acidobacteria bacterium]|nr:MAG: hypothetical protein DMG57_23670 [Acidobacteriota bacterium]